MTCTTPVNTTVQSILSEYESILAEADRLFQDYVRTYSLKIACGPSCSKCCDYYFPAYFIEMYYLQMGIQLLDPQTRQTARLKAAKNIPAIERFERVARAIEDRSGGVIRDAIEPIRYLLSGKIMCPLRDEKAGCPVYKHRPLLTRLFGIPLKIRGDEHSPLLCGLNMPYPKDLPPLDARKLLKEVAELSRALECLLTGRVHPVRLRFIWFTLLFPLEGFMEGGKAMKAMEEKKVTSEETRLKLRRKLLKLGAYSIPIIATVLATDEVYAQAKRTNPHGVKSGNNIT